MSSIYEIFSTIQRQRVSDGQIVPILSDCADYKRLLILVWPQLGDFDSLEYAWWLEKEAALWQNAGITIRAIGIGDRNSAEEETIQARPLPPFRGSLFNLAGGQGFQRPFELATLRLRNMGQVLGNWSTYIPDSSYLTQRGGTFLFDSQGKLLYEHRDGGILGFAENMSYPLAFLRD